MEIIVSNSNLGVMFKASDAVLKKYGGESKFSVPENIKGQSVLSVFKSLFGNGHFNICAVNSLQKLHDIELSTEHKEWMQSLHCIDYTDMTKETKEYLYAICLEYFKPIISMSYAEGIS